MTGKVIVIGGGETKEDGHSSGSHLLSHIFEDGAVKRVLVVIPPPSDDQEKSKEKYEKAFEKIVHKKPDFLFLEERNPEFTNEYLDKLAETDLVFFAGGQQKKYMEALSNEFIDLIQTRYHEDDNLCIAGTSAGAMIFSGRMIAEGSNDSPQVDEELELEYGINLLPNYIIDTHFIERGRFARLAHAIKRYPKLMGIGVEADTALMFKDNSIVKSFGCGTVILIDGSNIRKYQESPARECVVNLQVHLLVSGCTFNLKELQFIESECSENKES